MKNEAIETLKKNTFEAGAGASASGCCGGAAINDENACCALDEQKKSEGEAGCGCNTSVSSSVSACCG